MDRALGPRTLLTADGGKVDESAAQQAARDALLSAQGCAEEGAVPPCISLDLDALNELVCMTVKAVHAGRNVTGLALEHTDSGPRMVLVFGALPANTTTH